ncbi:MAG: N-6 DNA methylase, partial [Lentisphaeria bacterium]|nr:N-6 DNA methylase [Lentisphaeria bacterium]
MDQTISDATRRNWKRLNVAASGRLTGRANKTRSPKKILPVECFEHRSNRARVLKLLSLAEAGKYAVTDVLCNIAERLFARAGILDSAPVRRVLAEYPHRSIARITDAEIPLDEPDLLGIVYQAGLREGVRNLKGSYYTPRRIASAMVSSLSFSGGETFLDPCCGSGVFLISTSCEDPERLFGADSDPAAVMIAKFNLLLRYPGR